MPEVRYSQVFVFLVVTFGLSWGLSILVSGSSLPVGMFIPAFTALVMEIFFLKDSPLHGKGIKEPAMLVTYGFLGFTVLAILVSLVTGSLRGSTVASIGSLLFILWTLLVIQVYKKSGDSFNGLGLGLGEPDKGIPFVAGIVVYFLLQAGLNIVFGLGEFKGVQTSIEGIPIPSIIYPLALIAFYALAFIGGPLGNLAATFGEEYGWRGFLQRELSPLGVRLSVLVIGVIWATWHIPIIQSGIHTYPPTLEGYLMAYVFFILWSYVQTYSVLKTGSVWTPAFLHGVVNGVYAYTLRYIVRPEDILYSFGLGAYGLVCLFLVVMWILKDPIWNVEVGQTG